MDRNGQQEVTCQINHEPPFNGTIHKTGIFVLMLLKILLSFFMATSLDLLLTIQRQMPNLTKLDLSCAQHDGNDNEFLGTQNLAPLLHNSVSLTKVGLPMGQN